MNPVPIPIWLERKKLEPDFWMKPLQVKKYFLLAHCKKYNQNKIT